MSDGSDTRWFVLGFTGDQVVGSWEDARLASTCVATLKGRFPAGFQVLKSAGEGEYLIYWYANEVAARTMDASGIEWRRFLVGERPDVPVGATDAMRPV